MRLPLDITWRGVEPHPRVNDYISRRAGQLDRFAGQVSRCSVAVEREHAHPQFGSGWRVRLNITLPPGHEFTVVRESWQGNVRDDLYSVVKEAFSAARRQLQKIAEQRRGDVKRHVEQDLDAVITKIFPKGYGFVTTTAGREVYFHRNAVIDIPFERLKVGMGVAIRETAGEEGPQASTVRVVDRRGAASYSPESLS